MIYQSKNVSSCHTYLSLLISSFSKISLKKVWFRFNLFYDIIEFNELLDFFFYKSINFWSYKLLAILYKFSFTLLLNYWY